MRVHLPTSLVYLPANSGTGIVRLSGLEGLTRSLLMGTVPLIALDRLGSKSAVSQAYTAGAILTLLITLNIGRLEERLARRFFTQRYMRIAYVITFIRAIFWVSLFVFGPIYIVEAGFDPWVAGAFLSSVAVLLLAAPMIKVLADAVGTRRVLRNPGLGLGIGGRSICVTTPETLTTP